MIDLKKQLRWTRIAEMLLLLSQIIRVRSWTYVGFISKDRITVAQDQHHRVGEFVQKGRTTTMALSVFGWFQGGDAKEEDEQSDEILTANLSGVAGIMDSMASFKTSQRVSDRTNVVLQDLANTIVEGAAADGKVKVTYNGQQQPVSVLIDESYFRSLGRKNGAADLSIALTEAMQEAHKKSASKMEDKMKSLYADLGFDTT